MRSKTIVRAPRTSAVVVERHRGVGLAAWLTIAGVAGYVALDVVAQVLPPHYSPIKQAESDLADCRC